MKAILKGEGFMIIYDKELLFFQQNSGIVYDNSVWEKNQNLRGGKLGILWVRQFFNDFSGLVLRQHTQAAQTNFIYKHLSYL